MKKSKLWERVVDYLRSRPHSHRREIAAALHADEQDVRMALAHLVAGREIVQSGRKIIGEKPLPMYCLQKSEKKNGSS